MLKNLNNPPKNGVTLPITNKHIKCLTFVFKNITNR